MKTYNVCITFIFYILLCSAASAQVTDTNQVFNLICKDDKKIGFNWENSEWKQKNFFEKTYQVSKVDNKKLENEINCDPKFYSLNNSPFTESSFSTDDGISYKQGCYRLKEFGDTGLGDICDEKWRGKGKIRRLESVQCNTQYYNYIANIDGEFVISSFDAIGREKSNKRDSIVLGVGKCSLLQ